MSGHYIQEVRKYFCRRLESLGDRTAVIEELDATGVIFRIPYHPGYVGDPGSGALYGGFITTLLDTAFGMATLARIGEGRGIATVDLRIDYLTASRKDEDLIVKAECYKLGRVLAFIRGSVFHDAPHTEVAAGAATFILGSKESSQLTGGKGQA